MRLLRIHIPLFQYVFTLYFVLPGGGMSAWLIYFSNFLGVIWFINTLPGTARTKGLSWSIQKEHRSSYTYLLLRYPNLNLTLSFTQISKLEPNSIFYSDIQTWTLLYLSQISKLEPNSIFTSGIQTWTAHCMLHTKLNTCMTVTCLNIR